MEPRITQGVELLLRSRPEGTVSDPALAAAIVVKTVEALTHNLVVHGDRDRHYDLAVYVEEIVRLVASYLTAPTGGQRHA